MKRYFIQLIVLFGLVLSCSDDDTKPLIVTAADFTFAVSESAQVGDIIGEVPGTSNQGSVKFSIISQTPAGVFTIGEDYGELTIAETTALDFSVNQQILLEVQVSKDGVEKMAMVTVDIVEACRLQADPTPGDWILELAQDFSPEGWGGAFVSVKIDGVSTDYTLDAGLFETAITINVPEGTQAMFFTYVPGADPDLEVIHGFTIKTPDGTIVFKDGGFPVAPTPGELCFDEFEPIPPAVCNSTNFAGASGDWTLELTDVYADTWDGAFMTATIDGVATNYEITGGLDTESFTINVPDGTQTLTFEYVSGFCCDAEHTYTLTTPSGSVAKSDGPSPTPGEVCADDFVVDSSCSNTNFSNSPGDWTLELADVYADGWDGAFMTVTIDGVATDYEITGGLDTESLTINVPDGTQTLTFAYTAGDFEEEHSYTLTSPDGSIVKSDGPNPTPGELCND